MTFDAEGQRFLILITNTSYYLVLVIRLRPFFVRNPSHYVLMKCETRQFWHFENEFQHFKNESQLFENEFHYF